MSIRLRVMVLAVACACLLPAWARVAAQMPRFGDHLSPYGDAINSRAPGERHVTNMVSAVNFDYRGFDTLGEEFMLLCAVTGTVLLLRGSRGEQLSAKPGAVGGRAMTPATDAAVIICRLFAPIVMVFGLYVAWHAMTTPGGGFQGGVIIASGLLLALPAEGYRGWRRVARSEVLVAFEGLGAALYALCGFASMACGLPFLTNFLPFGSLRDVFSGGLMQIENFGVTCAVAGGFGQLFVEFLEETRAIQPRDAGE